MFLLTFFSFSLTSFLRSNANVSTSDDFHLLTKRTLFFVFQLLSIHLFEQILSFFCFRPSNKRMFSLPLTEFKFIRYPHLRKTKLFLSQLEKCTNVVDRNSSMNISISIVEHIRPVLDASVSMRKKINSSLDRFSASRNNEPNLSSLDFSQLFRFR